MKEDYQGEGCRGVGELLPVKVLRGAYKGMGDTMAAPLLCTAPFTPVYLPQCPTHLASSSVYFLFFLPYLALSPFKSFSFLPSRL